MLIFGLFCPLVAQAQGGNGQFDKKGELGESGNGIGRALPKVTSRLKENWKSWKEAW